MGLRVYIKEGKAMVGRNYLVVRENASIGCFGNTLSFFFLLNLHNVILYISYIKNIFE